MTPALLPGLCASIAVVCSARLVGFAVDARTGHVIRRRLGRGRTPSGVDRFRLRFGRQTEVLLRPFGRWIGTAARRRTADRDALLLLESTTRRLRSGSSLRLAIAAAASDCAEPIDRELAEAIDAGAPLRSILEAWMVEAPPARRLVGTALRLASDSGGAVASVLDGVAESLRDRLALDREVAALSSQARASALVLIVAPAVFALLMATIDRRVAAVQFTTPVGWGCCVVGLGLDALGAVWMSKMIARVR